MSCNVSPKSLELSLCPSEGTQFGKKKNQENTLGFKKHTSLCVHMKQRTAEDEMVR